jgi:predicted house-cleaning noncanonical NTP pyrophosphatase (MazG superfamily)
MTYNKLVRDKIVDIIEQSGHTCTWETLSSEQYVKMLDDKLREEMNEYLQSNSVEELADIVEVINAILAYRDMSADDFDRMRLSKRNERGGFEKRVFLKEVAE